jgi:hypothetical protein
MGGHPVPHRHVQQKATVEMLHGAVHRGSESRIPFERVELSDDLVGEPRDRCDVGLGVRNNLELEYVTVGCLDLAEHIR